MSCLAAMGLAAALAPPVCPAGAAAADIHEEPRAGHHRLSHDGAKTIVLRDHRKGRHFDILDTESGYSAGLLRHRFLRMSWGEDSDTAYARDGEGKLYRLTFGADGEGVEEISLTGPGAVPADEKPKLVKSPDPWSPFFLVRGSTGQRPLYRCDRNSESRIGCRILFANGRNTVRWLMTGEGRIVARVVVSSSGQRLFQKRAPSGGWELLFYHQNHYNSFRPIGLVQQDGTLWALSNRERERVALVRLDLATGKEKVFFEHGRMDLESAVVFFDRAGEGTPLLATLDPDYQKIVYFDDAAKAAYQALLDKVGRPARIAFKSIDRAKKTMTVQARNPRIHRGWYLLDLDRATARELAASDLESYSRPAAPSRPVSFRASDGLMLHGYLTLPERREDAGPPPMILMLHGGPWSRYRWPADAIVRFLGSEGYSVLRLNYRGSAGYDRTFLEAGSGTLFGRMQQDVLDAAGWAAAEGHAARGRIALFGGSFGGLLTLAMLSRHRHAFRAGIAINAVTDTVDFFRADWKRKQVRALWREFLGTHDLPVAKLSRISAVNNLDRIAAPVLLIAGAHDRRVPASHSRDLFLLMEEAGKQVELVEYQGAAHAIWNVLPDSREHIVDAIDEFLDEHLPAGER